MEDERTGLLVSPGERAPLARAMQRLAEDPALAQRLGQAGRARQRELFSVERYQADFIALYQQVLEEARA